MREPGEGRVSRFIITQLSLQVALHLFLIAIRT